MARGFQPAGVAFHIDAQFARQRRAAGRPRGNDGRCRRCIGDAGRDQRSDRVASAQRARRGDRPVADRAARSGIARWPRRAPLRRSRRDPPRPGRDWSLASVAGARNAPQALRAGGGNRRSRLDRLKSAVLKKEKTMREPIRRPIAIARTKSQEISLPFLFWAFGTPLIVMFRILYITL